MHQHTSGDPVSCLFSIRRRDSVGQPLRWPKTCGQPANRQLHQLFLQLVSGWLVSFEPDLRLANRYTQRHLPEQHTRPDVCRGVVRCKFETGNDADGNRLFVLRIVMDNRIMGGLGFDVLGRGDPQPPGHVHPGWGRRDDVRQRVRCGCPETR